MSEYFTTIVVWLVLVVVFLAVGQWLWSRRKIYKLAWQLNGEWSLPVIGHIHKFTNQAGK